MDISNTDAFTSITTGLSIGMLIILAVTLLQCDMAHTVIGTMIGYLAFPIYMMLSDSRMVKKK